MRTRYLYRCDTCHVELTVGRADKERHESEDKSFLDIMCDELCLGTLRRVWKANTLTHSTPGFYAHDTNGKTPDKSRASPD